jgi:hypothetical protein
MLGRYFIAFPAFYGMMSVGIFPYRLRTLFSWSIFLIGCVFMFINLSNFKNPDEDSNEYNEMEERQKEKRE